MCKELALALTKDRTNNGGALSQALAAMRYSETFIIKGVGL